MLFRSGFDFPYGYFYCAQEIGYIVQYLMEIMVNNDIDFVYGKGKRKTGHQRWYDIFLGYYIKLDEYEYWLSIIGERNSCSKTDHDATMCATKIDYYCNTGLSRPCYNAQIAKPAMVLPSESVIRARIAAGRSGSISVFAIFISRNGAPRGIAGSPQRL